MTRNDEADDGRTEIETGDDLKALETGDTLQIEYRSTQSDSGLELNNTCESEITDIDLSQIDGFLFGEITLAEYRNDGDEIERRRIKIQPPTDLKLQARRTTRNGAEWQRINQMNDIECYHIDG